MSAREHEQAALLLGAWALDALDPDEAADVESHVAGCRPCARETARLREVAGTLAYLVQPPTPPPGLKLRILDQASRARDAEPVPPALEPYLSMVGRLDAVLSGLDASDWARQAAAEWTVQDLVAHLAGTDDTLASWLRDPADHPVDTPGAAGGEEGGFARLVATLDGHTQAALARSRAEAPEATRAAWREQADDIGLRVRAAGPALLERLVPFGGVPLPVGHVLLDRAFETWIHTDDIAAAVGLTAPPPAPHEMHLMAETAVGILPAVFAELGSSRPDAAAAVTLTGPGGGDWVVAFGEPGSEPHLHDSEVVTGISVDVVEFCLLVGGRREVATLGARITGDVEAGRDLLVAAASLARP